MFAAVFSSGLSKILNSRRCHRVTAEKTTNLQVIMGHDGDHSS
jgi:hypothetical protein